MRGSIVALALSVALLGLTGCGSASKGGAAEGGQIYSSPPTGDAPAPAPEPYCGPCPAPAPSCPTDWAPAAPTDNGGDTTSTPAPDPTASDPTSDTSSSAAAVSTSTSGLVCEVTNGSSVTIDVTASTPDETVDCGNVLPGQTISVDLQEVPPYATLNATAVTPDSSGNTPTFATETVNDGSDYTDTAPNTSFAWDDSSDPTASTPDTSSTDTSSTDTSSTDTSSTDTSSIDTSSTDTSSTDTTTVDMGTVDLSAATDGTTDPGSRVRTTTAAIYLPRSVAPAPVVKIVQPKIVKQTS